MKKETDKNGASERQVPEKDDVNRELIFRSQTVTVGDCVYWDRN